MWDILIRQVLTQRDKVDFARNVREFSERFQFAREKETIRFEAVNERFLADAVASEEEPLARFVPDREGEHSVEFGEALESVLFVRLQENLDVGLRAEDAPAAPKFLAQLDVVVNLAVKGQPDRLIRVDERLTARARKVDNRETPMTESDAFFL